MSARKLNQPPAGTLEYKRWWFKTSPKARISDRLRVSRYQKGLRVAALACLGNKCANTECRWLNIDGSMGCTDLTILQIDHINGGGTKERAKLSPKQMHKKILEGSLEYQLLCPNCNWLKRVLKGETR